MDQIAGHTNVISRIEKPAEKIKKYKYYIYTVILFSHCKEKM